MELIEAVAKVQGIDRIRLGSLEPQIITDAFASPPGKGGQRSARISSFFTEWMRCDLPAHEPQIYGGRVRQGCAMLAKVF